MNKISEFFKNFLDKIKTSWATLSKTQKGIGLVSVAVVIGIVFAFFVRNQESNMKYLFVI